MVIMLLVNTIEHNVCSKFSTDCLQFQIGGMKLHESMKRFCVRDNFCFKKGVKKMKKVSPRVEKMIDEWVTRGHPTVRAPFVVKAQEPSP
jgi:hypothetical protein